MHVCCTLSRRGLLALVALALALTACQRPAPTAAPTPMSTDTPVPSTPAPTPTALPPKIEVPFVPAGDGGGPVLVQRSPEAGERLRVDGVIRLTFDRPMNQASVAAALKLQPAIEGTITWASPRSMTFTPKQPLPRNSVLDIAVTQEATGADGAALSQPLLFRMLTQGNLEVAQTIPAADAPEVAPDTIITVLFNRPVVPLTTLNQQSGLPSPLSFDPPLEGKAEWLNTSVLVFKPTQALPGGTRITGRIAADLKDIDGNPLAAGYTWSFTTAAPKVISISPGVVAPRRGQRRGPGLQRPKNQEEARRATVDTPVVVRFNQPVDPASAIAALSVTGAGGAPVAGVGTVLSDTLTFTPTQRLAYDAQYVIKVAPGVRSVSGGAASADAVEARFSTYPLPKILAIDPSDGSTVDPYTGITIRFNAPVRPETIFPALSMTPAFSRAMVYTYFNDYDNTFSLNFDVKPGTSYVLSVDGAKIEDRFGNRIEGARTVRFATRDAEPFVALFLPYGGATLNAYAPARLLVNSINVDRLDAELYRVPDSGAALAQRYLPENVLPADARLVRRFSQPVRGKRNASVRTLLDLAQGETLPPGAYLVRVSAPNVEEPEMNPRGFVYVSPLNLVLKTESAQAFVWATDLKTGAPVADLEIEVFEHDLERGAKAVLPLGSGRTDADGVMQLPRARAEGKPANWQMLFAVSRGERFAIASTEWSGGIAPYDFDLSLPNAGDWQAVRGHIYTDRPIYRAGQTVHVRGVLRRQDDFAYSLPEGTKTRVLVFDAAGNTVIEREVALDDVGAFALDLTLDAGAPLGDYRITVISSGANNVALGESAASFTVAAYRPPEFEVAVTPGVSETLRGAEISALINTRYLSGGALGGAKIRWNVLAETSRFEPPGFERYQFDDGDNPWRCFYCWWQRGNDPPRPLLTGEGVSDPNGELRISIPVPRELRDASGELISGTVRLSIEAVATGSDDQALAGRAGVTVHPSDFYVGVAFDQYVVDAGKAVTAEVVAVDWRAARLPGKAIEAQLIRREWETRFVESDGGGRWESEVKNEVIATQPLTTDEKGEARFGFTPPRAGTYKIVVRAAGANDTTAVASRFFWATGDDYVSWYRENNDRINLIANKTVYAQGETAEILIPSPFVDARNPAHYALVTVERGHILKHEVIKIDSSSTVYRLPLTDAYAPNVFVSVALMSGPGAARPEQKFGLALLQVTPAKQTLSVTLTPDRKLTRPGDIVTYTLEVKDASGQPVQGVFSIDLVDKGILNLKPRTGSIVERFYGVSGLSVNTASTLVASANQLTDQELERELAMSLQRDRGGGVMMAFDATAAPAAAAPQEAPKREAASLSAPAVPVRENFADTAYWKADVRTGADGRALLPITLPDNLTTWVIRAVGMDAQTRVGEGLGDVQATKPLLIRPVAPRFLVVGDEVELSAIVNNNTNASLAATVTLDVAGVALAGAASQTVEIPANGERVLRWTATASDAAQADLVFSVTSGEYSDASKPRLSTAPNGGLRINRWSAPETVGTAGELSAAGARNEAIGVPPDLDASQGNLIVKLDPSLAASMQDGLRYVEGWEYDCAEQTVSKFLPNVLTYRALQRLGIDNKELSEKLPNEVAKHLERLYVLQNADGGWGWWRNEESNASVSAYAVFGMLKAREAGFEVRDDVYQRALAFVGGQSKALTLQSASSALDAQTWLQYVLAEAGRGDAGQIDALYDLRGNLSQYAKALLILTIGKRQPADARIKTLFADLNAKVIQSATGAHWEESAPDWWSMNTDTRSTALVLAAFANYDKDNLLAPNIVRWLMSARKSNGAWSSTYETAWVLIALTDWMAATGELDAGYSYGAQFNGAVLGEATASRATITQGVVLTVPASALSSESVNRLSIARGEGKGRLYYTAHLNAYLPVPSIRAADRGIVIQRRYVKADCSEGVKCPSVSDAKVGDVLRVELTIIAPSALHYLQVEDPLPAGAEAIDTTLATASQLDEGPRLSENRPDGGPQPRARRWFWFWGWWSRSELRDDKAAVFATYLPAGTYTYTYTMRVTSAGKFNVIPAYARLQYFPEVFGRSDGAQLSVTR